MRVIFMGTPDFAVPTLATLLDSEYSVVSVVILPDRSRGREKPGAQRDCLIKVRRQD